MKLLQDNNDLRKDIKMLDDDELEKKWNISGFPPKSFNANWNEKFETLKIMDISACRYKVHDPDVDNLPSVLMTITMVNIEVISDVILNI